MEKTLQKEEKGTGYNKKMLWMIGRNYYYINSKTNTDVDDSIMEKCKRDQHQKQTNFPK